MGKKKKKYILRKQYEEDMCELFHEIESLRNRVNQLYIEKQQRESIIKNPIGFVANRVSSEEDLIRSVRV